MNRIKSEEIFKKAAGIMPGGVNSPVRAYGSVGISPPVISGGKGAYITDIDGNTYLDFVMSWGPLLFGHAHPEIVEAVVKTAADGTSFGAPTEKENILAEQIISMVPSIEMVRMVNSGTEAAMSAIRLARGYTGRNAIVKFAGCYHGHADSFLIKAGSGALTFGEPNSPGVTPGTAGDTLLADYNDSSSVKKLFETHTDKIAAVILEPVAGNMGVVVPDISFLKELREITKQCGSLLIFDEVITGFRLSAGGAQEKFGILPDLTILGKVIGGGLPVGAYGGSKEIMQKLSPVGPVYQAGTLSGNPLAMSAGIAMLALIKKNPDLYAQLDVKAEKLQSGIEKNLSDAGISGVVNRIGSMMTCFFTSNAQVKGYADAVSSDTELFAKYFQMTLESGISIAPSQFEAAFISAVHTDEDIEKALEANKNTLQKLGAK
jgi:glutamate-1-semialdehyde 2,1-aminomutase